MGNSNSGKKQNKDGNPAQKDPAKEKKAAQYGRVDPQAVKDFAEATNFDKVEVKSLYDTFLQISPDGRVDKPTFKKGLEKLEKAGLKNLQDTPFGERLFELLDTNGDGVVDLGEFVCGLSLLCKGSAEEKLELSFKAYDLDNNGYITKDELGQMFKAAWMAGFKALCSIHGNDLNMNDLNDFSEEMAQLFADNAFETLDTNGDGKLSFEEFKEFALAEPKITATLNGFKKEVNIIFA